MKFARKTEEPINIPFFVDIAVFFLEMKRVRRRGKNQINAVIGDLFQKNKAVAKIHGAEAGLIIGVTV